MRDILIIFIVLLVLLLIISTLGGSVRFNEKFESTKPTEVLTNTLSIPDINQVFSSLQAPKQGFENLVNAEELQKESFSDVLETQEPPQYYEEQFKFAAI